MENICDTEFASLLAESLEDIITIGDAKTYELLYMNPAALRTYQVSGPEAYQGRHCYEVLHGRTGPCPFCPIPKMRLGEPYRHEEHNEPTGLWLDHKDYLMEWNGRTLYIENAENITQRREGTSPDPAKVTTEDCLFRCLDVMVKEYDFNAAIQKFLEIIAQYYQADRAYIFEFDLDKQEMYNTYEWCKDGISAEIDNLQCLPVKVVDRWVKKFMQVGVFSISTLDADVQPDTDEYRILSSQNIQSLISAPLLKNDQVVGFLGVDNPGRQCGDLQLIRSVAQLIQTEFENRRLVVKLEEMCYTDQLTGICNRRAYMRRLETYQQHAPHSLGAVVVSINEMKKINTEYGTARGDEMIKHTVHVMQTVLSGPLFRINGDEFVAFRENVTREAFHETAARLRRSFGAEDDICRVAIGSAWVSGEVNPLKLLEQAKDLMYAEKSSYYNKILKSGYQLTHKGSAAEVLFEIQQKRFVAYFQPQIDLSTGRIVGAEALVRKIDEKGTVIYPDTFIPFYEMAGVIRYVDLWVLETACAALREWNIAGEDFRISVNFSRVTLMEPDIVEEIMRICEQYTIPPSRIVIEITETISKIEESYLQNLIATLKEKGFSISLDDFGSSYSNLAILSNIEFDEVKFDKSLVQNVDTSGKSRIVIRNSIRMCEELDGATSVAEGIETNDQLQLLKEYGCYIGQGYYFSRPIPGTAFSDLLKKKAAGWDSD